ncbi:MAG: BMC domain-containing protein [Bilophila sp.]
MLEYKPSLGFVETAGLVIAIQVADAMAKAAEVEIISAHKVDGLRVCVICKGDVAACQAAVETGATLAQSLNGLNGYNIIPSPADEVDDLMGLLDLIKQRKAAKKAAKQARFAEAKAAAVAEDVAAKHKNKK